jgi:hypothetical protein
VGETVSQRQAKEVRNKKGDGGMFGKKSLDDNTFRFSLLYPTSQGGIVVARQKFPRATNSSSYRGGRWSSGKCVRTTCLRAAGSSPAPPAVWVFWSLICRQEFDPGLRVFLCQQ